MSSDAPNFIGTTALSPGNEIRIELTEYRGRQRIDIRRWYTDADGELKRARQGIMMGPDDWRKFRRLVRDADKRAERDGLLPTQKAD
jgi:hypothetical protein